MRLSAEGGVTFLGARSADLAGFVPHVTAQQAGRGSGGAGPMRPALNVNPGVLLHGVVGPLEQDALATCKRIPATGPLSVHCPLPGHDLALTGYLPSWLQVGKEQQAADQSTAAGAAAGSEDILDAAEAPAGGPWPRHLQPAVITQNMWVLNSLKGVLSVKFWCL